VLTVEPQLIADYVDTGQVRLVFKPVLDFNPYSQIATEAAYCVGEQAPRLFWEMHDILYSRQPEFWTAEDKVAEAQKYASELDVDLGAYEACMGDHRYADLIVAQDQARRAEGIRQRPSFRFIGPGEPSGRLAAGAQPLSNFEKLIAAAAGQ
jgi:protein-disulfide isomerase